MSKKITIKTLENILKEMDKAVFFKNRISSDIEDEEVKELIEKGTEVALKNNALKYGIALGAGGVAAGGGAIAAGVIGSGAAIGGGGAAIGGGAIAAKAGAAAGAAAGAPLPIVGPIIGAVVGLGVGAAVGIGIGKQKKNKLEMLHQEVLRKQNGSIKVLKEELEELSKKNNMQSQEINRLKYILGCLATFNDIEAAFS